MSGTYTEDNNPIFISAGRYSISNSFPPGYAVLFSYSDGPGVVESIQLSSSAGIYNETLGFSVDGDNMSVDLPSFFGFALNPTTAQYYNPLSGKQTGSNTNIFGGINNENYIAQCDSIQGWGATRRVFIPFQNGVTISISGSTISSNLKVQVIYRKWPSAYPLYYSIGARRKYWTVFQYGTWQNPIVMTPFSTTTTPVTNGVGQIESITHILYAVSKSNSQDSTCNPMSCLEGEYTLTIDGNANTYGRSDNFWGGQYYWQNGNSEINGPNEGLITFAGTTPWAGDFNMQAYKYCYDDSIFFNQSFSLSWTYGNSTRSQFGQGVTNCQCLFVISYWTTN